jgi:MFS family permease
MAVFVGNGLEFYDFLTFSYFAVFIARTFYPEDSGPAALLATLAIFGAGFITRPIGAIFLVWLGDTIGRKPVMIIPGILLVMAIFPCFWIIDHYRNVYALYGAETVMVILAGISSVPVIVTITEQLPASIRSGAVATIYAFAISIFGGSTQFMIKWLITVTGDPLAPAYYWTGAGIIGLIAMALVAESAPIKQKAKQAAATQLS